MNWETTKDYLNSFIGAFILFLGLILIPEIRKSKKYWIPVLGLVIILTWLGFDKIDRDKKDKVASDNKVDFLQNTLTDIKRDNDTLISKQVRDSAKDEEFQARLFNEFRIIRDSGSNKPVHVTYNTNINRAETVNIGR